MNSAIPPPPFPRRRSMGVGSGKGAARLIILLGLATLAACAPGSKLPPLSQADPGPYRLGVNEQVHVITFGQDSLTGTFRVDDRGAIALPLLGAIPAAGLTTTELAHSVEQRLRDRKQLLHPSVSVEISSYRPIYVLGEVARPGEYPYQPGMTVLTAVAVAGGFTYRAQMNYASILRGSSGAGADAAAPAGGSTSGVPAVEGRVERGTAVQPGDVVNVFQRYF